jgi:hypothetical protein
MGTNIANRIVLTMQVIGWTAFVIGIGLIASVISTGIYRSLSVTH